MHVTPHKQTSASRPWANAHIPHMGFTSVPAEIPNSSYVILTMSSSPQVDHVMSERSILQDVSHPFIVVACVPAIRTTPRTLLTHCRTQICHLFSDIAARTSAAWRHSTASTALVSLALRASVVSEIELRAACCGIQTQHLLYTLTHARATDDASNLVHAHSRSHTSARA
eukprot:1588901-Pleurochrysis_carterae.AAC.2